MGIVTLVVLIYILLKYSHLFSHLKYILNFKGYLGGISFMETYFKGLCEQVLVYVCALNVFVFYFLEWCFRRLVIPILGSSKVVLMCPY
jgi:hypothetical protein